MILATPRSVVLRDGLILLICALVLRAATFGDPNIHLDEAFYLLIGQAMHHGAVPYIDIWDRKPFGLFALYWAITGISTNVVCYQLVAAFSAAATALVLVQIARKWVSGWAPLMSGFAYLVQLHPLVGMGGQSPVFYNLLMAGAALLLIGGWTGSDAAAFRRRYFAAMALCGLALTIKQTTLFEGIGFGLAGVWWLHRSGQPRVRTAGDAALAIVIAALPTLAIASWYAAHGFWPAWWNAMAASNAKREGLGFLTAAHNIYAITRLLLVYIGLVAIGLAAQRHVPAFRAYRGFMVCWLAIAVVGFLSMPNFFAHYALPLLVPMTPIAAIALSRPVLGPALLALSTLIAVILGRPFDFAHHRASARGFAEMTAVIDRYRGDRGLVLLSSPILLYPATHSRPLSPLVFPEHLVNHLERDVSLLSTRAELQRITDARPAVVLIRAMTEAPQRDDPLNPLLRYLHDDCRVVWSGQVYEPRTITFPALIYACR